MGFWLMGLKIKKILRYKKGGCLKRPPQGHFERMREIYTINSQQNRFLPLVEMT